MPIKLTLKSSDTYQGQLRTLSKCLDIIRGGPKELDLDNPKWVDPLLVLSLSALVEQYHHPVSNISSYLETVCFPQGVSDEKAFEQTKTYIPITKIPVEDTFTLENLERLFGNKLLVHLENPNRVTDALKYMLGEIITNIQEHSKAKWGWLFAQYFRTKEVLEVIILDTGEGFRKPYEKVFDKTFSDREAIEFALQGKSIKGSERGYGLRTTRDLVTQSAFLGSFLVISGACAYYADKKKETFRTWENTWDGAIIILRMNLPKEAINIFNYVE